MLTYMVGLFSRVYTKVALQRLQVTEACSTDLTWIWLLTRVESHVDQQVRFDQEGLLTDFT